MGLLALLCDGHTGLTAQEITKSLRQAQDRPNVLLISLDDLNDWIEPMGGHPQALTPNLASFAKESTQYRAIPLRSIVDN